MELILKKFIIVLSVLFFYSINSRAHQYDAVINLGGDCQSAYQMSLHGIRHYALPFDSLITPVDSVIYLLEEQFCDFLKKDNLSLVTKGTEKFILDSKYNVRLIHDFKLEEDFLQEYDNIKEKYDRRVSRFLEILQTSRSVLFIRKNITKEQALRFDAALSRLYPHLDFALLALGGGQDIQEDWGIARVKNRFLKQLEPYSWKGDPNAWKALFQEMGLELSNP